MNKTKNLRVEGMRQLGQRNERKLRQKKNDNKGRIKVYRSTDR